MRPVFESGTPVPAFLNKLWRMVDDENTDDLISWSASGKSFIIKHQGDFCAQLLPQFYKHSNMASFVRQLNMYGFHKVSNVENGGLRGDREEIEFVHPYFRRGEPKEVEHIKRKMSARVSNGPNYENSVDVMNRVLEEVTNMRNRQLSMDAQLTAVKQQNMALWRQLTELRLKHHKQQKVVANQLIQFLLSVVQPSRTNISGLGMKRKFPLMLYDNIKKRSNDTGPTIHELDNTEEEMLEGVNDQDLLCTIDPFVLVQSPESENGTGEVLEMNSEVSDNCPLSPDLLYAASPHLITPDTNVTPRKSNTTTAVILKDSKGLDLLENIKKESEAKPKLKPVAKTAKEKETTTANSSSVDDITNLISSDSGGIVNADVLIDLLENSNRTDSPKNIPAGNYAKKVITRKTSKKQNCEPSTSKISSPDDMVLATLQGDGIPKLNSANVCYSQELDTHLENMQNELESLKDLLGEGYGFDANTLLGLFSSEDPTSYSLPMLSSDENISDNAQDPLVSGSEVTTVAPVFDFDFLESSAMDNSENSQDPFDVKFVPQDQSD